MRCPLLIEFDLVIGAITVRRDIAFNYCSHVSALKSVTLDCVDVSIRSHAPRAVTRHSTKRAFNTANGTRSETRERCTERKRAVLLQRAHVVGSPSPRQAVDCTRHRPSHTCAANCFVIRRQLVADTVWQCSAGRNKRYLLRDQAQKTSQVAG